MEKKVVDESKNRELVKILKKKDCELLELKNQLSAIKLNETSYLREVESFSATSPEENKLQNKITRLQHDLSEKKQHLAVKSSDRKATILELQGKVKELTERIDGKCEMKEVVEEDDLVKLNEELEVYYEKVNSKQITLGDLQKRQNTLNDTVAQNQGDAQQAKEGMQSRNKELKEMYDLLNILQEDHILLKRDLSVYGRQSLSQVESSLFSEVNDPRIELQAKLLDLKKKCNDMKQEDFAKKTQLFILRKNNYDLEKMLETPSREDYNNLIVMYKDRIRIMEEICAYYEKLIDEIQKVRTEGFPNNDSIKFIEKFIEDKKKLREDLKRKTYRDFLLKTFTMNHREIDQKIIYLKANIEQLREKNLGIEAVIENTKRSLVAKDLQTLSSNAGTSNTQSNLRGKEEDCKADKKKVQFDDSSVDDNAQKKDPWLKKGGRVLQCKMLYFGPIKNNK